jgi:hypothetical protein
MFRERQYKRRIALWNLDKNIKDSDMKVMLRVQLQRRNQEGKETAFYLHGRPVAHQKLERYLRRKALSENEIMAWNMRESRPICLPRIPVHMKTFWPSN